MLEDWIRKQVRAHRERRARKYDQVARTEEVLADTYRLTWALSQGFEANSALQLLAKRGWEKHTAAAQAARKKAAEIRWGRQ